MFLSFLMKQKNKKETKEGNAALSPDSDCVRKKNDAPPGCAKAMVLLEHSLEH